MNNYLEQKQNYNNQGQIKILVADPQHIARQGVIQIVESYKNFEVVGEAENGDVLVSQYEFINPDILVVDVVMSQMNGFEAIKEIRSRYGDVKALFISGFTDDYLIYCSHSCGGKGFISKAETVEKFISSLSRIYNGFQCYPAYINEILAKYDQNYEFKGFECKSIQNILSKREIEIYLLYGTGKTTKQISDILHICKKTVSYHEHNIKYKLGLTSFSQLICSATKHCLLYNYPEST